MYIAHHHTPIGWLKLSANRTALVKLEFVTSGGQNDSNTVLEQVITQLDEYFAQKRTVFSVALAPDGTDFQCEIWQALGSIGYGKTASYKDIAQQVQRPKAYRAVGNANNRNPLPIIIPCHRVVGSDGKMVGYAGGLDIKQYLLQLENSA